MTNNTKNTALERSVLELYKQGEPTCVICSRLATTRHAVRTVLIANQLIVPVGIETLDEETRKIVRDMYVNTGATFKEISELIPLSVGQIREMFLYEGVQPPKGKNRPIVSTETTKRMLRMRRDGWALQHIADELGVSISTVHGHIKRAEEEPDMFKPKITQEQVTDIAKALLDLKVSELSLEAQEQLLTLEQVIKVVSAEANPSTVPDPNVIVLREPSDSLKNLLLNPEFD